MEEQRDLALENLKKKETELNKKTIEWRDFKKQVLDLESWKRNALKREEDMLAKIDRWVNWASFSSDDTLW